MFLVATVDSTLRRDLKKFSEKKGQLCLIFTEGMDIVETVLERQPSLVILDLYLTNPSGLEILRRLRTAGYQGKVVVLGGQSTQTLAPEAFRLGALQIVGRPFTPDQIMGAARVAGGSLDQDPNLN
jgi:DNA-binding response OmpR family regulator